MKKYTFRMHCSFSMQFTLRDEVEASSEGDDGDLEPTDSALVALQNELREYLAEGYAVDTVNIDADCDDLLGVDNEAE